jgi:hypothetical protein
VAPPTTELRSNSLTHQLVVLPARGERDAAVACALEQARNGSGLDVRDAAVLTLHPSGVRVTEPADDWPGRRRLGHDWWSALARALSEVGGHDEAAHECCFRHLVGAGMSRSFLEEAAMALAASTTTVVLLADRIDIRSLLPKLDQGEFSRVIYGLLPDAAVDELSMADES